jgi:hypothetical protein
MREEQRQIITDGCRRKHYTLRRLWEQTSGASFATFKKRIADPMSLTILEALQISVALDFTEEENRILYGRQPNEENIKKLYQ